MPKLSLGIAMCLLVFGNFVAVFSDALIKQLPEDTAVFQFLLFRQVTAVLLLWPIVYFSNKTESTFVALKWHGIRGHIWLLGAFFMVIALNALPLATVNAIFYTSPILMLLLARLLFNEKLTANSIIVSILGFVGVLIIVKPTHFDWAAIAALIVAITMAANNLLVRQLPEKHNIAQTLFLTSLLGIPISTLLALWESKPWHWEPVLVAFGSNLFILTYAGICVWVYRSVEANKVAASEYTGLIGAVIVGIWWFNELPDYTMYVGSTLIVIPLIYLAHVERKAVKAKRNKIEDNYCESSPR